MEQAESLGHLPQRLDPPQTVRGIAERLENAGFETWCVGGAVRDALLGLGHLDWDLATAATPQDVRRLFKRAIPVGEEFGTVGVLDSEGVMHEVTTFRRDVKTDGRHAVVEFGASLDEDLARRDFTINAIAWSPLRRVLHDPFDGQLDLRRRVVRAVGDARVRMKEDRLRALRALRFAGRFDFSIEEATWRAVVESSSSLDRLSMERVQQELTKTLVQVAAPGRSLMLWKRSGALRALVPALDAQPEWRLRVADAIALPDASNSDGISRRRMHLRLAALLAGLEGREPARILKGLRFSNRDAERIAHLAAVAAELAGHLLHRREEELTDRELRKWAARAGRTDLADALRVAIAVLTTDSEGLQGTKAMPRLRSIYRRAVRVAYRDPVSISDLAVDGEDLIREGGVSPGPAVGGTLRQLRDWVLDDPVRNTRDALLAHARGLRGTTS